MGFKSLARSFESAMSWLHFFVALTGALLVIDLVVFGAAPLALAVLFAVLAVAALVAHRRSA